MSQRTDHSLSLAYSGPPFTDGIQKLMAAVGGIGLLLLFLAGFNALNGNSALWLSLSLVLITVGVVGYSWRAYLTQPAGIRNSGNFFSSLTHRGLWAWVTGVVITAFYVLLYFYPGYLGLGQDGKANSGLVGLFDPLSYLLAGRPASQWFVYGTLYTLAILVFGVKFMWKYRHNRYQIIRTISVMFFQTSFAFLIPEIIARLNSDVPYNDFKNMWPLNYYFFDSYSLNGMINGGALGLFMLIFGVAMIFIISPTLTYFYGKRWYCSWVCGCGGLAETAGDPFRHLSDKSLNAWRVERWLVHGVLVFVVVMTIGVLYSYFSDNASNILLSRNFFVLFVTVLLVGLGAWLVLDKKRFHDFDPLAKRLALIAGALILAFLWIAHLSGSRDPFFIDTYTLRSSYGFLIGAIFSGVVGVGFYPLMGSRVWCRFGCPMAAILGIQQRFFSRFRITTNGGQCISCGNCSAYCEMGIDVRAYAQKGQNILRASCVGCGICAAVCPRGVLRLENGSIDIEDRTKNQRTIHVPETEVQLFG